MTESSNLPPTEMIYMTNDGNFQLECTATILKCAFLSSPQEPEPETKDDNNLSTTTTIVVELVLDRTVLHAQGGGQPSDWGCISLASCSNSSAEEDNGGGQTVAAAAVIKVNKVLLDRSTGIATHTGTLSLDDSKDQMSMDRQLSLLYPVGSVVQVQVDASRRRRLAECHTAGHVLDSAMSKCGLSFPPIKGYHFLEGPYVEYKGTIAVEERATVLDQLQQAFQQFLDEDVATTIQLLSPQEAHQVLLCHQNRMAETLIKNDDGLESTVRVVTVAGWSSACGGTHVKSTGELNRNKNNENDGTQWFIKALQCKKGVIRVKYGYSTSTP
jgi:Ser-tRNA(Ala) deacylase AlaX